MAVPDQAKWKTSVWEWRQRSGARSAPAQAGAECVVHVEGCRERGASDVRNVGRGPST